MPISVTGSDSLEFVARIDTSEVGKDTDTMLRELEKFRTRVQQMSNDLKLNPHIDTKALQAEIIQIETKLSSLTVDGINTGPVFKSLNDIKAKIATLHANINIDVDTKPAIQSIETLRAKILAREDLKLVSTDPKQIAGLNKEIEVLTKDMTKLQNIGKTGFDEFGNAIPKKLEKTGGALSAVSKGFSFFRQAAYLIPGIGLAGIFNLIGEGVAALVTQLFKGGDAVKIFARNFENLKAVMAAANKDAGAQITDLKILYSAATNVNLSMDERLRAVKALKAEFPDYFGNIDSEIILNGKAKKSYEDLYLSILQASRAKAAKAKLDELEAQRLDIAFQKQKILNATKAEEKRIDRSAVQVVDEKGKIVGGVGAVQSTQEQEAAIAKRRSDALAKEALKDAKLNEEQKFLIAFVGEKAITDTVINNQKTRNAINKAARGGDKKYNDLLNERLRIMQMIEGLNHDAFRSGLLKEDSEIDRINEKYDNAIKNVDTLNKKIEEANKKRGLDPNTGKIGSDRISQINSDRATEINNSRLKAEAEKYKTFLLDQQKLFEQYENAKKEIGIDKANEMFDKERDGFTSYQDFLQAEVKKNLPNIQLAMAGGGSLLNRKDQQEILDLFKALDDEADRQKQRNVQNFKELIDQTADFSDRRQQIEEKYQALFKTLAKNRVKLGEDEYERRLKSLQTSQDEEIKALKISFARQSELYKKLGEDTLLFTKKQLKDRIAEFKKTLDTDTSLTPQMKADIQAAITSLQGLMDSTDDTVIKLNKFIEGGSKIKSSLDEISTALDPFNQDLAEAIRLMSSLLSGALSVASSLKDFNVAKNAGDTIGQIAAGAGIVGTAISVVTTVISLYKKAKEERLKAQKEIEDFNLRILTGELAITEEYRQRQREQVKLNRLRIEGLEAERKLLEDQKIASQDQYKQLLAQIQKETFVAGEKTKTKNNPLGALLGIGGLFLKKTEVQQITESLAGKTFDELEQLFNKGQLVGKAKDLFEQLQKLRQEGVDIDQQLQDLKERAAETFTGTTADAIVDSIAEGFKDGLHSAADFSGKFEDFMRQAIVNSLKYRFLEGPIKDLFDEFAADSQSGGALTKDEIKDLQTKYNAIINNANKQFQDLQNIAGINFSATGGTQQQNTVIGNFKAITEDTANVLAGQFGGMRVAQLQLLDVQRNALGHLHLIETNTANTVFELQKVVKVLNDSASGMRPLKVNL
jgi:hypothetical protein